MPAILLFWSRAERYAPMPAHPGTHPGTYPGTGCPVSHRDSQPPGTRWAGGCRLPRVSRANVGMPGDVPVGLPDFGVGHPERMLLAVLK